MDMLEKQVHEYGAITRPATQESIDALQASLGFALSKDYCEYLTRFGIIAHEAYETYGLGVPDNSHLNVLRMFKDLSADPSYPANVVPVLELGDGQYYLYDNCSKQVFIWATPNGGVVRELSENLEQFLINHIFSS